MVFPILGSLYLIIGAFFLYRVYRFWGAGVSPYYANAFEMDKWGGFEKSLDIILWTIVVLMLIIFLFNKYVFYKKDDDITPKKFCPID